MEWLRLLLFLFFLGSTSLAMGSNLAPATPLAPGTHFTAEQISDLRTVYKEAIKEAENELKTKQLDHGKSQPYQIHYIYINPSYAPKMPGVTMEYQPNNLMSSGMINQSLLMSHLLSPQATPMTLTMPAPTIPMIQPPPTYYVQHAAPASSTATYYMPSQSLTPGLVRT